VQSGKHPWRTESFMQISDGRRVRGEGEIDLAARSWKGTLLESRAGASIFPERLKS